MKSSMFSPVRTAILFVNKRWKVSEAFVGGSLPISRSEWLLFFIGKARDGLIGFASELSDERCVSCVGEQSVRSGLEERNAICFVCTAGHTDAAQVESGIRLAQLATRTRTKHTDANQAERRNQATAKGGECE